MAQRQPVKTESDHEAREKMHGCLEKCLDELPNDDRELILEYYRGVAAGGFALGPPVERAWHPPTGRARFSG